MTPAPLRCIIFAAVSTKAQASHERDSIPDQIKRARRIIEHRGWIEVGDPLVVPGQSRSIDFLHEAIEDIPAVATLINTARHNEIDLLICRDYDRLARTRTLLAQLSTYLSRCRVQIYALDKPVEPVSPEELGRRGRGVQSATTVETLAGLMAEGEVNRIADRRYFGMNAVARSGKWKHARVAYGYTRLAGHSGEKAIYTDVPRLVPEETAIVQRMERLYLEDGLGSVSIAKRLNGESVPSPSGKEWRGSTILKVLKNPFYCGYVVWGLTRMATIFDHEAGGFVSRPTPVQAIAELKQRLGHEPTIFDLLDHADELAKHDVVITRGDHEPCRSEKTQRALYDELARRREMGGRAVATIGRRPPLLTGIIFCACCGSPMVAMTRSTTDRIYYVCRARRTGQTCPNAKYAREIRVYNKILDVFYEIAKEPQAIDDYLQERQAHDTNALHQERAGLLQTLENLDGRRQRWDDAYEASVVDLAEYSEKITLVETERGSIEHRLSTIEQRLSRSQTIGDRRAELLEAINHPPPPDERAVLKVYLRRLIERIEIRDGEIERLTMRI
jgi:DNA invertase Pin-like site-specific DNA recombinase